jgi:hypothetical protein
MTPLLYLFSLLQVLALAQEPSPARKQCGGIYNWQCDAGQVCVDDPKDACVSGAGGYDCPSYCVPKTEAAPAPSAAPARNQCGGIYNWQCDAGQVCVDDPKDACVSGAGGYDCPSYCVPQTEAARVSTAPAAQITS